MYNPDQIDLVMTIDVALRELSDDYRVSIKERKGSKIIHTNLVRGPK